LALPKTRPVKIVNIARPAYLVRAIAKSPAQPIRGDGNLAEVTLVDSKVSQTFVTAFARGLAVIEAFGPGHKSMTLAEVAARIGVDRAVTRRLLLTLVELGYATQTGRQFELTTRILKLGYSYLSGAGLGSILQPYLDELSREIEETVSVSVLEGAEVMFVARAEMPGRRMAYVVTMGMRLPAFSSSSGRVLLAAKKDTEVEALLSVTTIKKQTDHTILQRKALLKIIQQAKVDGFAVTREELEDGLIAVSVPLTNRAGLVVASLNISASTSRMTDKIIAGKMVPRMQDAAEQMSKLLP
jgi:IclR family pca regulon transcriptional regulator